MDQPRTYRARCGVFDTMRYMSKWEKIAIGIAVVGVMLALVGMMLRLS